MTSAEIIGAEVSRLIGNLPNIDPYNPQYRETILLANSLMDLGSHLDLHNSHARPVTHPIDSVPPFPEPSVEEYVPPVMNAPSTGPGLVGHPDPAGEPGPKAPEPEETAPTYTKEEVRAALAKSRKKGVNVTELLSEFGAENFTGLPAAKYGELMARLESM